MPLLIFFFLYEGAVQKKMIRLKAINVEGGPIVCLSKTTLQNTSNMLTQMLQDTEPPDYDSFHHCPDRIIEYEHPMTPTAWVSLIYILKNKQEIHIRDEDIPEILFNADFLDVKTEIMSMITTKAVLIAEKFQKTTDLAQWLKIPYQKKTSASNKKPFWVS